MAAPSDGLTLEMEQGPFKTGARRALQRDGWADGFVKVGLVSARA